MKKALARFIRDERGATAIEYGLIVGLISLALVVSAGQLGTDIGQLFTRLSNKVTSILATGGNG
ncbi:Flp family type IVb pilin [Cupriavidus sp. 30B13]|uniref:Flp family type IVb pilin n=1 Tax=Cupriavidus sp. 30B13 TaxID=3384241 RepID=UPI003B8FD0A4